MRACVRFHGCPWGCRGAERLGGEGGTWNFVMLRPRAWRGFGSSLWKMRKGSVSLEECVFPPRRMWFYSQHPTLSLRCSVGFRHRCGCSAPKSVSWWGMGGLRLRGYLPQDVCRCVHLPCGWEREGFQGPHRGGSLCGPTRRVPATSCKCTVLSLRDPAAILYHWVLIFSTSRLSCFLIVL